jgi:hypothetical protein
MSHKATTLQVIESLWSDSEATEDLPLQAMLVITDDQVADILRASRALGALRASSVTIPFPSDQVTVGDELGEEGEDVWPMNGTNHRLIASATEIVLAYDDETLSDHPIQTVPIEIERLRTFFRQPSPCGVPLWEPWAIPRWEDERARVDPDHHLAEHKFVDDELQALRRVVAMLPVPGEQSPVDFHHVREVVQRVLSGIDRAFRVAAEAGAGAFIEVDSRCKAEAWLTSTSRKAGPHGVSADQESMLRAGYHDGYQEGAWTCVDLVAKVIGANNSAIGELYEAMLRLIPGGAAMAGADSPVRVVVNMDGGVIHMVRAEAPVAVLIADADTDGLGAGEISSVNGEELYLSLHEPDGQADQHAEIDKFFAAYRLGVSEHKESASVASLGNSD